MARVVFLSRSNEGHLFQALILASALKKRGHEVTVVSYLDKAPLIAENYGVKMVSLPITNVRFRLSGVILIGVGAVSGFLADFLRVANFQKLSESMLRNGEGVLQQLSPDIVIVDQNVVAGATLCERLKLPFVTIATSVLWHAEPEVVPHFTGWSHDLSESTLRKNRMFNQAFEIYMKPVLGVINKYRRRWKLKPLRKTSDTFSPLAQLAQLCPTMDFPRKELPQCFHYIGTFGGNHKPSLVDFPWQKLDGRPLVFASMGTVVSKRNFEVFKKISEACSNIDAQLVMSLGRFSESVQEMIDAFGQLPNNQIIVGFAPQIELLKRASLLITHAGVNTVLEAILNEVPMIALPRNVDHPAMASRIEYAGIGLRDSMRKFKPEELCRKIEQILADPSFKQRLKIVREDLERCGGSERAADIIEQCLQDHRLQKQSQ